MKFWTRRPAVAAPAALSAGRAGIVSSVRPALGRRRSRGGRIGRNAAKVSVFLAAVVLAGAAGIPASASVPVSASAPGWSVTPSPNPVIPTGQLYWVSCPAANFCMAVGTYTKVSGAGSRWPSNRTAARGASSRSPARRGRRGASWSACPARRRRPARRSEARSAHRVCGRPWPRGGMAAAGNSSPPRASRAAVS